MRIVREVLRDKRGQWPIYIYVGHHMRPACGVRTRIGRVRDVCCHTDYVRAVRQSVRMQAAIRIA